MCNEIRRTIALGEVRDDFAQLRIPLRFPEDLPNFAPAESVRITDRTPIVRWQEDAAALVVRRWSWPGANGRPVYNYRSEGRRFENGDECGRCLIPASGFYEFTDPPAGEKRKSKWRFSDSAHPWLAIAGWWRAGGEAGEAFTMLTCAPGPDVAPYHHRQIVLIPREGWQGWLDGGAASDASCRPMPAGSLCVERA